MIEESEQFSAIDEAICGGIVDQIVHEGFSDFDSDATANLETNLDAQETQVQVTEEPSQHDLYRMGRKDKKSKSSVAVSKKRKRGDTQADFAERQHTTKQEA